MRGDYIKFRTLNDQLVQVVQRELPDVREDIVKRELCFSVMIAIAELQCEAALWVSVDCQYVVASIGERTGEVDACGGFTDTSFLHRDVDPHQVTTCAMRVL